MGSNRLEREGGHNEQSDVLDEREAQRVHGHLELAVPILLPIRETSPNPTMSTVYLLLRQ